MQAARAANVKPRDPADGTIEGVLFQLHKREALANAIRDVLAALENVPDTAGLDFLAGIASTYRVHKDGAVEEPHLTPGQLIEQLKPWALRTITNAEEATARRRAANAKRKHERVELSEHFHTAAKAKKLTPEVVPDDADDSDADDSFGAARTVPPYQTSPLTVRCTRVTTMATLTTMTTSRSPSCAARIPACCRAPQVCSCSLYHTTHRLCHIFHYCTTAPSSLRYRPDKGTDQHPVGRSTRPPRPPSNPAMHHLKGLQKLVQSKTTALSPPRSSSTRLGNPVAPRPGQ